MDRFHLQDWQDIWRHINTRTDILIQREPERPSRTPSNNKTQLSSITTSSKLTHSCSTCVFQHGCWAYQGKLPLPGKPTTGCPALSSSSHSSLSSLSTGQQRAEFSSTRATSRHSGTVHRTVHWVTLGDAHWESQQGLGKQLSFYRSLFFSCSSAPLFNSLSLSLSLMPRLSLLLKKFTLSLSLLLEWTKRQVQQPPPHLTPRLPPDSIMKHNQYSAD